MEIGSSQHESSSSRWSQGKVTLDFYAALAAAMALIFVLFLLFVLGRPCSISVRRFLIPSFERCVWLSPGFPHFSGVGPICLNWGLAHPCLGTSCFFCGCSSFQSMAPKKHKQKRRPKKKRCYNVQPMAPDLCPGFLCLPPALPKKKSIPVTARTGRIREDGKQAAVLTLGRGDANLAAAELYRNLRLSSAHVFSF